jgi:hypothetical protein
MPMTTATVTKANDKNSSLLVTTSSHHPDFQRVPKLAELRDKDYKVVDTRWFYDYHYESPRIHSGVYIISVSLSSGEKREKVVELQPNENKPVSIDFSGISPRESQEWAYLTKRMDKSVDRSGTMKSATRRVRSMKTGSHLL